MGIGCDSVTSTELPRGTVTGFIRRALRRSRARYLADWVINNLAFPFDRKTRNFTCTTNRKSTEATGTQKNSTENVSSSQRSNSNGKRSRSGRDSSSGGHNGNDGQESGGKPSERICSTEIEGSRLACPFYKRNRWECRQLGHRACSGSGWKSIHRLKEHLNRCHSVYQCERCSLPFLNNNDLKIHRRISESCRSQKERRVFAINQETWILVKRRTRRGTREEQWIELYRVIFSHADASRIPSPCNMLPSHIF
ncbi:hypothetical protein K469DRAFT_201939 [Zopfia rhizophila CBS 207.26]|uniref:C2H2-type domain-containing protein n=1 Tax=Zopfia rhizophila CBS 207.26 TaxID=1314779 RepID=A0A6A6E1R6_9PEZI|nr:hypothetical protein K469DRAFT_201939 [Zopfia rhizophila CBS 207.26]